MRCDYAFICDFAQDSGGKVSAIGIGWETIFAPSVPVIHPQMSFVASLTGTIAEAGIKNVEFRLINADGGDVLPPMKMDLELVVQEPALEGRMNLVVNLNNIEFTKFGKYAMHLVVQGNEMARCSFSVISLTDTS